MRTDLLAFVAAFVIGLVLTRAFRDLAIRSGLYDKVEEGGRKLHTRPIPRIGGIAVAFAFGIPLAILGLWSGGGPADLLFGNSPLVSALVGGGAIILALGIWDDVLGVRAIVKFGLQATAALLVCAMGVQIESIAVPFVGSLDLGWLSVPVTMFWIVLITNAVNLIDGMDGLAGSVVALAGSALLVMNIIEGDVVSSILLAAMVGAVCAFLVFNVNPASIFMGDAGSLFLGFLLAIISVHSSQKAYTVFSVVGAALILAVPIFDLSMAVVRRALTGKPLFSADQHHVHHLLLRRGLSQRQSMLVLAGAAAAIQILALALIYASDAVSAMLMLGLVPVLAVVVRLLGYTEIIRNGRREIIVKKLLQAAEERENLVLALRRDLADLNDADVLWVRLQECAAGLGLERLELEIEPTMLGFATERRRVWQRSISAEDRGINLQNLEKRTFPLKIAGRQLGTLRTSHYTELQLFGPHDRALMQLMADVALEALVLTMAEDSRMDNVLPFRGRLAQQQAT